MNPLPPLSTLRAFEATARTGSVTRAAEELRRTHGAISRQLRLLQEHAGTPLFEKAGTGLRLTEAGHAFHEVVRAAFAHLEQGYARLVEQGRSPGLHVACSATFAMRWLVPRMAEFYRAQPSVRIRLSMTSAGQMRAEGADLLVAWDLGSYSAAEQRRAIDLAPVHFGPVCAPAHARHAARGMRIAHDFTSSAWTQWEALSGRHVATRGELRFPHTHLCIEAAVAGLGVALAERRMARRELDEGTLVAPYGFVMFPVALRAVPMDERPLSAAARAFVDWMRQALREPD
ncbi:LysR family transcriptional regulator [Bordetella ansorpii]|uniref:LysR family transcriptional regulator n=1 Tax=Bordetella ansorpii TaxID=288768 RepID=A0A157SGR7_9BORD|nr:LysR substrate-binding domain-containing protein [Bordetella ansorpii]SAI69401.1 LysR family transcriptional regulator [Bordetella ansorpii]